MIDYRVIEASPPDNMIYHPVRDFDLWLDAAETRCAKHSTSLQGNNAGGRLRAQAVYLNGLARACLAHPVYADAALVPLILAKDLWIRRPWAQTPAYAQGYEDADRSDFNVTLTNLQRRFGVRERRPQLGTAHMILARRDAERLTTAGPGDFDIDEGVALGRIPTRFLLPFAYDLEADEMLLTAHVQTSQLLTYPFLYAAQRETARVLVKLPIPLLAKIFNAPPPSLPPVFIFSLGRTGSTLLEKLIGCVTARSISEPDIITQLAAKKTHFDTLPPPATAAFAPARDERRSSACICRTMSPPAGAS